MLRPQLNSLRSLPSFIIVGCQKGGTSSLFEYLVQHPDIFPAREKELHFFDLKYGRGLNWYRSQFPLLLHRRRWKRPNSQVITGEATPYYMFHPHAPRRMAKILPRARLIAILRDPVKRAFSHFQHNLRGVGAAFETLSFEDAIACENERLGPEIEKMMADQNYNSPTYQRFSYVARGLYVNQIDEILKHYPREQLLVLKSEEMFSDPQAICSRIFDFLEMPPHVVRNTQVINRGGYKKNSEPSKTEGQLREFYAPYNQQLFERIGEDFGW